MGINACYTTDAHAHACQPVHTCGAADTKAAIRAVTLQPAAVISVNRGVPLDAPTTLVPSVICKVWG